ncbi:HAF repeat-containing protein [Actinoplanes sp. N902-109]|uniref:HAF repeat-containing protein n=1 Tax=Actinoplanes sp. (strain N902-109) TaxID=649831 RepID=UPI0003293A1A|nr:HAF repeat-containing protein [Actinoplanes sp. N902-109]AGL16962.1 extracellular repeat protein, HAF family [Actinoplanes sp. N902-109]
MIQHPSGIVSAVAAALLLAPVPGALAVPATPALVDLGPGTVEAVNTAGDIAGYSGSSLVLWRHGTYERIDLGVGGTWGPVGLNEHADVVGHLSDGPAFRWHDGVLTPLAHPTGDPAWAAAINDSGLVAGFRGAPDDLAPDRPFVWRDGVFTDVGPWHGLTAGEAVDVNDRGQVLINMYDAGRSAEHALLWDRGRLTDLGNLGSEHTTGTALNDHGAVIGMGIDATGAYHPFQWQHGRMTDLWPAAAQSEAVANAINTAGDVVGYVIGAAGVQPVRWRHGVAGFLMPDRYGVATAVNDRGDVAGITFDPTRPDIVRVPFRWRHGRVTGYDVLEPALAGNWVSGIDGRGRVIGTSVVRGGMDHVVVWTAGQPAS